MGESVIEEICSRYPMNPMQLQQLENYSEGILQKALSVTNGSAFVDNRSAYLLGICKKLKERADNPPTRSDNAHKPQETKSSSYQPFQVETQAEKQQKKSALMEIARKHRAVRDEHIKGVKGSSSSGVQENNMTIDNLVEQVKLYDELAKENPFFYYAKMSAINKYNAQNAAEFVQAEVVSSPEKQKSDTSNGFRRLFDI